MASRYYKRPISDSFSAQRNANGPKTEIPEAAPGPPAPEDDQPDPEAESRLRLRRHLAQERLQHPHRLHPVPGSILCNICNIPNSLC